VSFFIERRLRLVGRRLASVREELRITDEQLAHFADLTDDSRIRAMVSETPQADEEHRHAERTSSAMARHREELVQQVAHLEHEQDDLLDQLSAKRRPVR
jgi:cell division septum initiation protein DivIVA